MPDTREAILVRTLVMLADSLVTGYDIVDVLQTLVDRAAELFDTAAAGITLGLDAQHLEVIASTSQESQFLGLMQVRAGEGPCVEAVRTGTVVSGTNLTEMRTRWPAFAETIVRAETGYLSVHAIPLRLREQTIGSLNLFRNREGLLNDSDAIAARGLADIATIAVLQERTIRDGTIRQGQLQQALDSRVVIEQAKGILAQTHQIDMATAFHLLRDHARSTRNSMKSVAAGVIDGTQQIARISPS